MTDVFKQYKLSSGEEIICEVHNETDKTIEISDALAMRVDRERGSLMFEPWMSNQLDLGRRAFINTGHVVGTYDPEPDFVAMYLESILSLSDDQYHDDMSLDGIIH